MKFLTRLDYDYDAERWLVEAVGQHRIAVIVSGDEPQLVDDVECETARFHGQLHPRMAVIHLSQWLGEGVHKRLLFEVDDDRGPTLVDAAASLSDPIERERWSVAQIIAMCDALTALRRRDREFVHRRLTLDLMRVDVGGHLKLRAPIARVVQGPHPAYVGAGTRRYSMTFLSPEQVRGEQVTPATDVFALAGILYAALSGRPPFRRHNDFATLQAIIDGKRAPLAIGAPGLAAVIDRALIADPVARIRDPEALAAELSRCAPDAADYDAVISDKIVSWRPAALQSTVQLPTMQPCRMRWEQLTPTDQPAVRRCGACQHNVVYVTSLAQIAPLSAQCVAYRGD